MISHHANVIESIVPAQATGCVAAKGAEAWNLWAGFRMVVGGFVYFCACVRGDRGRGREGREGKG